MLRSTLMVALLLSSCSSLEKYQPLCPGTRYYDPQVCKGEKFTRLPNFVNQTQLIMDQCGSLGPDCPGVKR